MITVVRAFDRAPIETLNRTPFELIDAWLDEMAGLHLSRNNWRHSQGSPWWSIR